MADVVPVAVPVVSVPVVPVSVAEVLPDPVAVVVAEPVPVVVEEVTVEVLVAQSAGVEVWWAV